MSIKVGDSIPSGDLFYVGENGPTTVNTSELFAGKKVVLFSVVGPYTGTCNDQVPTILGSVDAMRAKGVDDIILFAVNDPFVMQAWEEETGAEDRIRFLSDGNATWSKALGLTFDGSKNGLGIRGLRYAAVVEDGKVTALKVEDSPGVCSVTAGPAILEAL